ncbi:MAG: hypothetical protein ACREJR_03740, partial [Candidatus Rokuibacteriota bacterium]
MDVNTGTGEVTATAHPNPSQPKLHNFLMTARQVVVAVHHETKIRIHVHDSIQRIWLTPNTLTIHVGSDECRFTVLALFDDGTIGDITDWPQLRFQSGDLTAVKVLHVGDQVDGGPATVGGVLVAEASGRNAVITVKLDLTAPPIALSANATVFTKPSWTDVATAASVRFVEGMKVKGKAFRPNETDLHGQSPDSVNSVVTGRTNFLFLSEGFTAGQETRFRQDVVDVAVNTQLRAKESLQPFKLLASSINYWTVFVPSPEEGVGVLGDQQDVGGGLPQFGAVFQVPLPRQPAPAASDWTLANMIHEGGLPVPVDPPVPNPPAWTTSRRLLYDIPAGAPLPSGIDPTVLDQWNDLRSRSLLNERDSALGMAHYDRPRASGQGISDGRLGLDSRRTSEKSLRMFLEKLEFGKDPASSARYSIGETWLEDVPGAGTGKDAGLIGIICHSDTRGAMWKPPWPPPVLPRLAFFTASTGRGHRALVRTTANGKDIMPPVGGKSFSAPIFASLVAYGCGRALDLQDEHGDGEGGALGRLTNTAGANVQLEVLIVSTSGGIRTIDARKIGWLWPRVVNVGIVKVEVDFNGNVISPVACDQSGAPNPTGSFLLVEITRGPSHPFVQGDLLRLRASVTRMGSSAFWNDPSSDQFAAFPLVVERVLNDKVVLGHLTPTLPQLGYRNPATPQIDPALFSTVVTCFLIAPVLTAGTESKLIADPVQTHIDVTDSPLSAPFNAQGQACTPAAHATALVTPTNLPAGLILPPDLPSKADIIGIYDGGAGVDCQVYR